MNRRMMELATAGVVLLLPFAAAAYRPFNSTDAAVAAKGEFEAEVGPLGYVSHNSDRSLIAPGLILNWGFADRWELVLEGRNFIQLSAPEPRPTVRLDDTALSLKGVLRPGSLQESTGPSIATELSALLPTINGEAGVGAELALIASQRWSALTLHLNGAAAWTRSHQLGYFVGAIVEGPHAWSVRPVGEVFIERAGDGALVKSGLLGAIWRISDGLALDVAVRVAPNTSGTEVELRFGFTFAAGIGFPR